MVFEVLKHLFAQTASCSEGSNSHPKRADPNTLKEIFLKHASVYKNGERYMSANDFVNEFLRLSPNKNDNDQSIKLLAGIVDTSKDGLISFLEFQAFEELLCVPDAIYRTAFQLFDIKGKGTITLHDFTEVVKNTELNQKLPCDVNNDLLMLYFGKDKSREMTYTQFSQFLHDFHEEYGTQAFKKYDKDGTGFISAYDFKEIMLNIKNHLTKKVEDNLIGVTKDGDDASKVSFPFFTAFNSLLKKMELVKRVYLTATNGSHSRELTKDEFQYQTHKSPHLTPMEVDILFKLCQLSNERGKMAYSDLQSIAPDEPQTTLHPVQLSNKKIVKLKSDSSDIHERTYLMSVLESLYRLALGFLAGATGAAAVYPIDLVKTRMQNQRINPTTGERMYNHSVDCFIKVIKNEGILGLYRGLIPQLCGVAPEKAAKLAVNDFIRDHLAKPDGFIPLWAEILAGGSGGAAQVTFSCPVEIVKIQLQVAGEVGGPKPSAISIIKEKFFFGLYKGAAACYCRDITFAGIYFPTYSHVKKLFVDETGYNEPYTLFISGLLAGVPAASLATPFDVVKTRLQVKPRPGQTTYNGITDAVKKVWREEGWTAFWKGAGVRVCRSSPQFGVTLLTYELLQRLLYYDFAGKRPEGSEHHKVTPKKVSYNPDHIGGYEVAIPMITEIETQFGISLPKFNIVPIPPSDKKINEP